MNRKLFEYFFQPHELEPFYSELTGRKLTRQPASKPRKPVTKSPKRSRVRLSEEDASRIEHSSQSASEANRQASTRKEVKHEANGEMPLETTGAEQKEPKPTLQKDEGSNHIVEEHCPETEEPLTETNPETELDAEGRSRVRNLISVHALGQYLFCSRSGILAAERGDSTDVDEPLPRLTFLPNFDLARIEEALSSKLKQVLLSLAATVALAVSMIVSMRDGTWDRYYLAGGMLFLVIFWAINLFGDIIRLALRRYTALNSKSVEPRSEFHGTQPINWWSLLKAGFEPIQYQRPFRHPELSLEGCPWRVLQKDSLRIPVIKSPGNRLGESSNRLFPKHEVRLVAYALLLEADGYHKAPYGLVFPADSSDGLAFAITDQVRNRAVRVLADFEKELQESQLRGLQPDLPDNRNKCANCQNGTPQETTIRKVAAARKAGENVVILESRSERIFRCDCGDRFGSAPPHKDSIRMGLKAILE